MWNSHSPQLFSGPRDLNWFSMIIRFVLYSLAHHTTIHTTLLPIVTEAQQATSATQIQYCPSTLSHHIHQPLVSRGGSGSETRHAPTCLGWSVTPHILGMTHLEREELSSHIKLVVFHLLTLYLSYTWLDGLPDLSVPILTCYTEAYYWEHRGWWAERYLSTHVLQSCMQYWTDFQPAVSPSQSLFFMSLH